MTKPRRCLPAVVALLAAVMTVPRAAALPGGRPVADPIPESPLASGLGLTLERCASFPQSEPTPAPVDPRLVRRARINFMGEVPDGSGRMYVPDLNGRLYLVE